jgi:carboxyl-terminal processing protease
MKLEPLRHSGAAIATALVFASCGGSSDSSSSGSASCDLPSQYAWLRNYMFDAYYWSGRAPSPDPAGFTSLQSYFQSQFFGGDSVVPADRWSYYQDSASYNQFFAEGTTLGYGVFLNGIEQTLPLKVRYVEAQSPAAAQLVRGDTIVSLNGRSAADVVAANDFSMLSPAREGDVLNVVIDSAAGPKTIVLTAATYTLTPVSVNTVMTLPSGARAGYLVLKDFITQAEGPLVDALAGFRAAGATELIIDLRYNGGGRISTANVLASLITGATGNGKVFAHLAHNANRAATDTDFILAGGVGAGFTRAVIITGARACSASELIVNGLKPHMQVVTVGAASCGKPFGFNPVASCGNTFSAVNFESFNAQGQGRYYNGIAATCAATDEFSRALGDPAESLTAAALDYLGTGACPAPTATQQAHALASSRRARSQRAEPGERQGMWAD